MQFFSFPTTPKSSDPRDNRISLQEPFKMFWDAHTRTPNDSKAIFLGWVELSWVGLGWVGLGWVGLGWVGLGWVGLDWIGSTINRVLAVCNPCWVRKNVKAALKPTNAITQGQPV